MSKIQAGKNLAKLQDAGLSPIGHTSLAQQTGCFISCVTDSVRNNHGSTYARTSTPGRY